MIDLTNKTFPKSPLKCKNLNAEQLKQFLSTRADYEKSAFVSEGHMEVRALNPKEFTQAIPPGESGITALLRHSNGHVYGATGGEKSHLFFYNPAPDADAVADIGVVVEGKSWIRSLVELPDGTVLGAGNLQQDNQEKPFLVYYKPCDVLLREKDFSGLGVREIFDMPAEDQLFFSTIDPCHSAGTYEVVWLDELKEGIADLVHCQEDIFLLGATSGIVYQYAAGRLEKIFQLDPNGKFSPRLCCNGTIYGAGLYGRLMSYDIPSGNEEILPCRAPSWKGCEIYTSVTAWAVDARQGMIYGGTADGLIFRFDPENRTTLCLGRPTAQSRINALAFSGNRLFAIVGEADDCAHLAVYEPELGSMRDLGCPLARSERPWNGYRFEAMICGKDGMLFLGEFDRISHLFLYFPAVE